jgi:hypothetical protein
VPCDRKRVARKFRAAWARTARIAGSFVGPSCRSCMKCCRPSRPVVFAVCPVVLVVIRNEIVQREAVVRGHEVDARERLPPVCLVEVGRSRKAVSHISDPALVAAPEVTHTVAVFPIPLRPAGWKFPDVVAILSDVPRLGDQLHGGEDGI